jgi:hypothetical protein
MSAIRSPKPSLVSSALSISSSMIPRMPPLPKKLVTVSAECPEKVTTYPSNESTRMPAIGDGTFTIVDSELWHSGQC